MNLLKALSLGLMAMLASCEKDELPVAPFDRGDVEQVQIEMGADYINQVWFDLENNEVVSVNNRFDWDIAFDCSDSAHWVYLNGAVAMMAAPTGNTDFSAAIDQKELFFRPDHPWGFGDSLSLGRWWESDQVWVIDLGYEADGSPRGKRKIKFELTKDGSLSFRYALLNGNDEQTGTIKKDALYNRVMFSFTTQSEEYIEPPKTDYDLVFSQYMHLFYAPYYPYLVTGAILNPANTLAAQVTDTAFEALTAEMVELYTLTDTADVIGYDWKFYDIEAGQYTVFPEMNYLVKDQKGFLYKLHFVDFYNSAGEKGYPLMEVKRL